MIAAPGGTMPSQPSLTKDELAALSSKIAAGDLAAMGEFVARSGMIDRVLEQRAPKDDSPLEEYKLLLAKIDKLGDYRLTIRGWSATIILGLLLGGSIASAPGYILLLALPIVAIFYLMEAHQNDLQTALQKRAASLERIMDKVATQHYQDPNPYVQRKEPIGLVPGIATAINKFGQGVTGLRKAAQNSDAFFYLVQAGLILIAFCAPFFFHPAKRDPTPQNVYYFNAADTPQAPEQPNGKPEDQRAKSKPPKR
jgi:hypothetical protein